jgi:hypothetical protein
MIYEGASHNFNSCGGPDWREFVVENTFRVLVMHTDMGSFDYVRLRLTSLRMTEI